MTRSYFFWLTALFISNLSCELPDHLMNGNRYIDNNLVKNPSFEINENPSIVNWIVDSLYTDFVEDTPVNGGRNSLLLFPGMPPSQPRAETYITGLTGVGLYELKVSMKSLQDRPKGIVTLKIISNKQIKYEKQIKSNSTDWKVYSIVDTLFIQKNDTVSIYLTTELSPLPIGVLFDLIEFERL